jgi:hypothetical protein
MGEEVPGRKNRMAKIVQMKKQERETRMREIILRKCPNFSRKKRESTKFQVLHQKRQGGMTHAQTKTARIPTHHSGEG